MDDQYQNNNSLYKKFILYIRNSSKKQKVIFLFFAVAFLAVVYAYVQRSPSDFPVGQVVTVYPGESLQEITNSLKEMNVIKHPFIFRTTVILLGGEKNVMAGDYLLDIREGSYSLARRLTHADFKVETVKATIPEGWNIFQIAEYLDKNLINFDEKLFLTLAKKEEGYLFPDTYFISPAIKPDRIIALMKSNFNDKMEDLDIEDSDYSLHEIITMASILESEARTTESRRTIAGILWKRLSIGMPLQVDSTFLYVNGKNTYELTLNDLQIDSPYNTYKYKGLPPGPINNPGIDSIKSALNPISTKYLYFLSSRSGDMYYAKTFEEHKKNKELYLNK